MDENHQSSRQGAPPIVEFFAPSSRLDELDPVMFVRQFVRRQHIEILFDGRLIELGRPLAADRPDMVDQILLHEEETISDLIDQMVLFAKTENYPFKKDMLKTACRRVVREARGRRLQELLGDMTQFRLSGQESEIVAGQWDTLAGLFDLDAALSVAILKHFIWQVKRKSIGLPIMHHLMPIIWGSVQGSGKTTFVRSLLEPLRELAPTTYLSDVADRRSGDIFRFPVLFLDEMDGLDPQLSSALKMLMTTPSKMNRKMGSSGFGWHAIRTTFIGTSNMPIQHLIHDETGHRRFAMLPFRNGSIEKGGNKEVWQTVQSLDYYLLWRSVWAFGPSPIIQVLSELHRHQGEPVLVNPVLTWLIDLDIQSEAVKSISYRAGAKADLLRLLYEDQTGNKLSPQRFSEEMTRGFRHPDVPFGDKRKLETGAVYMFKRRRRDAGDAAAAPST